MKFVRVAEITLHYELEGAWPPEHGWLVFINSLGTDLRIWDELVPYFAERFAILRYDMRGHGLSDCPEGPYSTSDLATDLMGLMDFLAVKQAIVVGISVGGLVALKCALANPDRIVALVLSDTASRIGTAEFWNQRIEAVRSNGLEQMASTILDRWFAPSFAGRDPTAFQGYSNMLVRTPLDGYVATCKALRDSELTDKVAGIRAKSLVLTGEYDLATPPSAGRKLAERLVDGQFELIAGAGHLPCIEQPQAMAMKMQRFFEKSGYV